MRRRLCALAWSAGLLGLLCGSAAGQAVDTTLVTADFNRLKTPESPAFQILGLSPAAVARPTSPRAFAFSFLNSLREQTRLSLIPTDFAIEVNPYWWAAHPDVSFHDYQAGGLRSLYRTMTFSLATTDSAIAGPDDQRSFRRLGVGLRTYLYGRQQDPPCIAEIEAAVQPLNDQLAGAIALRIARDPSLARDAGRLEAVRDSLFRALLDGLPPGGKAALSARARQECTDRIADRRGFVVALAGAAGFGFLQQTDPASPITVPDGGLNSVGLWITPSWLGDRFSAIGIARIAWSGIDTDSHRTAWDVGARAIYAYGRYAGSFEALARQNSAGPDRSQFRVASVFDIRLSEEIWLTTTFGRDFDARDGSGLIALANLQWNIGKPAARPVPIPGR